MPDTTLVVERKVVQVLQLPGQQGPAGPQGPQGPSGGIGNFVWNEVPAGAVNGVNRTHTLAHAPVQLLLALNGLIQSPGASNDYTLSGSTITWAANNVPRTGDAINATYTY